VNEELKVRNAGVVDVARLVIAVVLVIAGVAAFYEFDTASSWLRWTAVVGGLVLGIGVVATSAYGRAVIQFVLDSRVELRKIVWPSQRESMTTTAVVFVFVIVASLFFLLSDQLMGWVVSLALGVGA